MATVTGRPLTCARLRPWAEIRRVTITWSSSSGPPTRASTSARIAGSPTSNTAAARASFLPRAHQVGRRLAPEHQPQARQEQALARPRLAGPGAIAALELDAHVLDQRQVLNRELAKHDARPP